MERYLNGQVCLNGHVITGKVGSADTSKFCIRCGDKTISACLECNAPIRGDWHADYGYLSMSEAPSFCHECGKPYAWTERAIAAAKELADEVEGIDDADRERAKESFIALASDTPQTTVAVTRVKKLIQKAGPILGGGIRDILVDIATEAAKKGLGF